ncbi:MAG: hypothetical protein K1Y36_22825 [Blastocatellia bacterium]|nr:hypothetical protein [Blastocatellia bacterium]
MKSVKLVTILILVSFGFLLLFPCTNSFSSTVAAVSMPQMTRAAGRIFVGICREVAERTEPVPKLGQVTTLEYRFSVVRTLKGETRETLTIRHLKTVRRSGTVLGGLVPTYQVGGQYLLFLTAESQIGLCAPVGLQQGTFRVTTDAAGHQVAVNGNDNLGLFRSSKPWEQLLARPLSATEHKAVSQRSGPVELNSLLTLTAGFLKEDRK